MVYYLIGAENILLDSDKTHNKIVTELGNMAVIKNKIDVEIKEFKLSNVDSLISSNETMLKMETHIEAILKKIERAYLDITENAGNPQFQVQTKNNFQTLSEYVQNFKWDNNVFSRSLPLVELLKSFQQKATTIDNDIRQKQQLLQEAKNSLNSVALKDGNLLVKDLNDVLNKDIVKEKDFIYTENLTTVCIVVPKSQVEQFQLNYELMHHCVVPGSAKQFAVEDRDYTLWRVIIFKLDYKTLKRQLIEGDKVDENGKRPKTPVEEFTAACRDRLKSTVKEFEYSENQCSERETQRTTFQTVANRESNKLKQTCEKSFGNLYEVYIHLKHLRLVVEIAAKFGQKTATTTVLIQPVHGKEKMVQNKLLKLFADRGQLDAGMYGTKEELEDTEDFFPYAYVPINI